MLLKGLNHVAVITNDATRLNDFYREVFDAEILRDGPEPLADRQGPRLSIIKIGDWAELNVFEMEGNTEADRQTPMFGRGRLDHLALQAASIEDFETIRERLMAPRRWPTTSSPTSGPCSASSSVTPTVSSARSASRIPTRYPASSTGRGTGRRATPECGGTERGRH